MFELLLISLEKWLDNNRRYDNHYESNMILLYHTEMKREQEYCLVLFQD